MKHTFYARYQNDDMLRSVSSECKYNEFEHAAFIANQWFVYSFVIYAGVVEVVE